MKQEMLSVKEICKIADVTRKTLFHYDKIGLLEPTIRSGKQGAKLYNNAMVKRLLEIRLYRMAGISIDDIRQILTGGQEIRNAFLKTRAIELDEEMEKRKEIAGVVASLLDMSDDSLYALINSSSDIFQLKQNVLNSNQKEERL